MTSRIDVIGQNGNDGEHYDFKDGTLDELIDFDKVADEVVKHIKWVNSASSINAKRSEILDHAKKIINGQREDDYGSAEDNFKTIASFWSEYLSNHVSAKDVAMMMILLKVARMGTGAGTEDCLIDICGYAALAGEM